MGEGGEEEEEEEKGGSSLIWKVLKSSLGVAMMENGEGVSKKEKKS